MKSDLSVFWAVFLVLDGNPESDFYLVEGN